MGASFNDMTLPGTLTRKEVRDRFELVQDQDRHENGHSYSGGFGMAEGLEFRENKFSTVNDAVEWLHDNAQKWEAALAVRAAGGDHEVWVIGAFCSS